MYMIWSYGGERVFPLQRGVGPLAESGRPPIACKMGCVFGCLRGDFLSLREFYFDTFQSRAHGGSFIEVLNGGHEGDGTDVDFFTR